MLKKILTGVAIVLAGWLLAVFIPWQPGEERPGKVLQRYFAASNAGDSAAAVQTLSKRHIEYGRNNPSPQWWRTFPHSEVEILWDSADGNVGYVKYRLHRTYHGGKQSDTVAHMQVFKENGQWKVGGW
jgi:hypothetical protein